MTTDPLLVLAAALNEHSASVREATAAIRELTAALRQGAPLDGEVVHGRVAQLLDGNGMGSLDPAI